MDAARVAVITGGSSGIGAASSRRFAADGHRIAILDVNDDLGEALVSEHLGKGQFAKYYRCDVSDEAEVENVAKQIESELGIVQYLVTSAALIPDSESILDMDMRKHDRMWKVNYNGTLNACRSFGRQMAARRSGSIVTIGSINSLLALPLPAYNPGKVAVARLTQLLSVELGRHTVRANCVAPTYIMTAALQDKIDAGLRSMEKILEVHALDRIPLPEDVADAIAFLCSDQAKMITGILLPVDAGWHGGVSYLTYAGGAPWKTSE